MKMHFVNFYLQIKDDDDLVSVCVYVRVVTLVIVLAMLIESIARNMKVT